MKKLILAIAASALVGTALQPAAATPAAITVSRPNRSEAIATVIAAKATVAKVSASASASGKHGGTITMLLTINDEKAGEPQVTSWQNNDVVANAAWTVEIPAGKSTIKVYAKDSNGVVMSSTHMSVDAAQTKELS